MFKKSLLLMLLMALFVPWAANAQNRTVVTIGEGTSTQNYPLPGYYGWNYDVFLYTPTAAPALDADCDISSIAFNVKTNSTSTGAEMYIWVKDVDADYALAAATTFSGYTDGATQVYENDDFSSTAGWNTFAFTRDFSHEGGKALLVAVRAVGCSTSGGCTRACYYTSASNTYWYKRQDGSDPGTEVSGSVTSNRANIQLDLTYTGAVCLSPSGLAASNLTDNSATISWTENGSATAWVLQYGTDNEFGTYTEENVSTTPSFNLTRLDALTTYYARVKPACDTDGSHWSNTATFSTTAVAEAVGDRWNDDFEGSTCGWELINGTLTNNWVWGTAVSNGGTHSLYISKDGGSSNTYDATNTKIFAAKLLNFTNGKFEFSFDWRCKGESTWDFLRVALVPASLTLTPGSDYSTIGSTSLPTGWIAVDGGSKLNLQENWQNQTSSVNVTAGNYYLVLAWRNDTGVYDPPAAVDNVSITKMACPYDVEGLAVTDGSITTTGAAITWTAGEATQWQVAYKKAADSNWTELTPISTNSYSLTSLAPSTNYQVKVRAFCGGTDYGAWCSPVSFPTECDVIPALGYTENFDSYTTSYNSGVLPLCWSRINTGTGSYSTNPYVYNSGAYSSSNCLYFYTYGSESTTTISDQYAVLPEMSGLEGMQITLFAKGSSTTSTFKIGLMEDPADVSTFQEITTQALTTSYQEFVYQLSDKGSHIAIMMPKPTGSTNTSYGVYIDNISIAEPPQCPKPTGLALVANTINGHGATFEWTSEADAWDFAYKKTTDEEFTIITTGVTNPYPITGLLPETAYTVKVRANCGSGVVSEWSTTASFTTGVACAVPTGLAATLTPGQGNLATLSWTSDASQWVIAYKTADEEEFTEVTVDENPYTFNRLTAETTYTAKVKAVCGGEDGESQWSSTITFTPTDSYFLTVNDGTTTNEYVPFYGYYADNDADGLFIIPAASLTALQWGTINKLTFYVQSPATGNFTSYSDTETEYEVYMKETDQTTFETATISFEGMTLVKNSYHITISDYKLEVTLDYPFDYMGGNLMIGFDETVSGGYHHTYWYGVEATGASIGGYTSSYGSNYSQRNFLPKTTFGYTPGEEPSCFKPTGLSVNNVTKHTADLSWTSDADAWQIQVNEGTPIDVTTNPYTLTGLDAETDYSVKVRANCGTDGYSDWTAAVTFTTEIACPAPTAVTVSNIGPLSATVSWTGEAEAYNLHYREITAADMVTVTLRTDDVWGDGSGYQMLLDADATAYGTIIPETGALTTSGDVPAATYAEFEYKIPANADGALATTNMVCEASVTIQIPAGTYDWCVTNPTPGDRMWIASSDGNVGGRYDNYVFEAGKTYEFYVYNNEDGGDAVDVTITDAKKGEPKAAEWTLIENVTSPYTLNNLVPETNYIVEVQANCGDDGTSAWAGTNFSTPSNCQVPEPLDVTDITTNSATLNWTGIQDSYQVQYRTAASREELYFEDFDGQPTTWTRTNTTWNTGSSTSSDYWAALGSGSTETAYLISPDLSGYITSGSYVEFKQKYISAAATFQVGFSSTTNDVDAFRWDSEIDAAATFFAAYNVAIPDETKYIAIQSTTSTEASAVLINDFGIYGNEIPAGSWHTASSNTTTYPISGLDNNTLHEWQVRGVNTSCTGGYTEWSELVTFTTLNACEVPVIDSINNILATTATVYWTGAQESFNVRYGAFVPDALIDFDDQTIPEGWTNDETYPWTVTDTLTDAGYCIRSTNQGVSSSTSTISFRGTYEASGVISFDAMFMGEGSSYDVCTFSIDGSQIFAYGAIGRAWYNMPVAFAAGAHTFTWAYTKDSSVNATGDFFAIDNIKIVLHNDTWTTVEGVTGSSYDMTGLTPESVIAVQVQGNNTVCDGGVTEWSSEYLFMTPEQTGITQTATLIGGAWNRFGLSIEVDDPVAMLDALKEQLGDAGVIIETANGSTENYGDNYWWGDIDDAGITNEEMILIEVSEDVDEITIELQGEPANPANHQINIVHEAWNRIGFPCSERVAIEDALTGFDAVDGDVIEGPNGQIEYYEGVGWWGDFEEFIPGEGYMFNAVNATEDRTLVFSTGAKKARNSKPVFGKSVITKPVSHNKAEAISFKCKSVEPNPIKK